MVVVSLQFPVETALIPHRNCPPFLGGIPAEKARGPCPQIFRWSGPAVLTLWENRSTCVWIIPGRDSLHTDLGIRLFFLSEELVVMLAFVAECHAIFCLRELNVVI